MKQTILLSSLSLCKAIELGRAIPNVPEFTYRDVVNSIDDDIQDVIKTGKIKSIQYKLASFYKSESLNILNKVDDIPGWMIDKFVTRLNGEEVRDVSNPNVNCVTENCENFLDFLPLWGYGCWCMFGMNSHKGHGQAVDKFDEVCRDVTQCYRCVMMDGEAENSPCFPNATAYTISSNQNEQNSQFANECRNEHNVENCQWRSCSCDTQMFAQFWEFIFSFTPLKDEYSHETGFNFEEECDRPDGGNYHEKSCCGDYPLRKTYVVDGDTQCCENRNLFNNMVKKCCGDGSIVSIGTDC